MIGEWKMAFGQQTGYKAVNEVFSELQREGFHIPETEVASAAFTKKAPDWVLGDRCHLCRSEFNRFKGAFRVSFLLPLPLYPSLSLSLILSPPPSLLAPPLSLLPLPTSLSHLLSLPLSLLPLPSSLCPSLFAQFPHYSCIHSTSHLVAPLS